jgi:hypothetical protein
MGSPGQNSRTYVFTDRELAAKTLFIPVSIEPESSTTDFTSQVARILEEEQAKGPLHRVGLPTIDEQDDFWSSAGRTTCGSRKGPLGQGEVNPSSGN